MAFHELSITTNSNRMEFVLDEKQSAILLVVYRHGPQSITEIMRSLKLGGDTFYRHKEALVRSALIREVASRDSRIRVVKVELSNRGIGVATLLDKISALLNETF